MCRSFVFCQFKRKRTTRDSNDPAAGVGGEGSKHCAEKTNPDDSDSLPGKKFGSF
ncbi:MAG: hypothetical protein BWY69_00445 [Planctomycetes bacterium ADurb.Bin401]|nr:MAG: hypothetical protein BWY69_00445 [Planctomycetes bacterium ADurb.Bin401]